MAEELEQAEQAEQVAEQAPPERNERFKWYILHAYSGFERKVRESIQSRIQAFGLGDKVGRVMIPTEPVTEIVNGKKRTTERVFLPGYVLVEMELDNNLWHVLKDTPKVTGCICPLSRVELPLEVIYAYPEGHAGQGLAAPAGYVLGRNTCTARVPLMPLYVAVITMAAGRSICAAACPFCALPMWKSGSMANVFSVPPGVALNPLARVSGLSGPFCTLKLLESGDCCAICMAMVL